MTGGDDYSRPLPKTIEGQTRQTLDNIVLSVEAAGGTIGDIFKVVIMLKNPEDYTRRNAVRQIGPKRMLLSSDCGPLHNPPETDGIRMMHQNPADLIYDS